MMAKAPVNGQTLQWARKAMNLEVHELARAANVSEQRLHEFESGDAFPTLRQLEAFAKRLDRTPAFFFTEHPTESDVPTTADFRAHSGEPIPSLLAREMRRAAQHRETVIELDGLPHGPELVNPITWNTVASRAMEMRDIFGLERTFVPPGSQGLEVLNFWRKLLEQRGFLIFQTTRVDLNIFRGLSIHNDALPIIILNGADSAIGKVFTLFHEVAHLINRTSGMCGLDESINQEALANAFAANFLMPQAQVETVPPPISGTAYEYAAEIAGRFKVSELAAGVRLRTLSLITESQLAEIRRESDERWSTARKRRKEQKGGPPPWRVRYRDLGSTYIGTIARALEDERVDLLDASYMLNARIPMVQQMLDEYYLVEGQ